MPRRKAQHDTSAVLGIQKSKSARKCSLNILPCQIHYDGRVNASKRYWNPVTNDDGGKTSYFRGRKLRGKEATLLSGYRGVVLRRTDQKLMDTSQRDEAIASLEKRRFEMDEEQFECERQLLQESLSGQFSGIEEVAMMEEEAEFDSVTVWRHEVLPDLVDDPHIRVIDQWMKFANAIHSYGFSQPPVDAVR